MSINWRPISEFNKSDEDTEYLFYTCYQAYDYVSVGRYYPCKRHDGGVDERIDCGFDIEGTYPSFRHITHFAEINLPD